MLDDQLQSSRTERGAEDRFTFSIGWQSRHGCYFIRDEQLIASRSMSMRQVSVDLLGLGIDRIDGRHSSGVDRSCKPTWSEQSERVGAMKVRCGDDASTGDALGCAVCSSSKAIAVFGRRTGARGTVISKVGE